jgi:hypothetical protein
MAEDGFAALLAEVTADGQRRFGHREHVHLTWLAVRRCGMPAAVDLVSDGIQRTARYAGAPQKYHATVSRAWVEIIAHHAAVAPTRDFAAFVAGNPELFDKRLLSRFYSSAVLAGAAARAGWVQPDREPFPFSSLVADPPRSPAQLPSDSTDWRGRPCTSGEDADNGTG